MRQQQVESILFPDRLFLVLVVYLGKAWRLQMKAEEGIGALDCVLGGEGPPALGLEDEWREERR